MCFPVISRCWSYIRDQFTTKKNLLHQSFSFDFNISLKKKKQTVAILLSGQGREYVIFVWLILIENSHRCDRMRQKLQNWTKKKENFQFQYSQASHSNREESHENFSLAAAFSKCRIFSYKLLKNASLRFSTSLKLPINLKKHKDHTNDNNWRTCSRNKHSEG